MDLHLTIGQNYEIKSSLGGAPTSKSVFSIGLLVHSSVLPFVFGATYMPLNVLFKCTSSFDEVFKLKLKVEV